MKRRNFIKASTIFGVTPITTALFATFFLGELFTFAHLIGTIIVIISIIVIVNQKRRPNEKTPISIQTGDT